MSSSHPRAIAAASRASKARAERLLDKERIAQARLHDVRFLTVGIHTIAYRVDKSNVVEFSIAIKHPQDRFNKVVGQTQALAWFTGGQRVRVRLPNKDIAQGLRDMFIFINQ